MNTQEKRTREIEAFLAGEATVLDTLYGKLPRLEPDAKLDKAVLAMARHADMAPNPTATHRRLRKADSPWLFALSSAAALALVVTLAWRAGTSTWNHPGDTALPASVSSQVTGHADTTPSAAVDELAKKNLPNEQPKPEEAPKDKIEVNHQVSSKAAPAASTTENDRLRRSDPPLSEKEQATAQTPFPASAPLPPPAPPAPLQRDVQSVDKPSSSNEPQPFVESSDRVSPDRVEEIKPGLATTPKTPSLLGGIDKQNQEKKPEKAEESIQPETLERSSADQRGYFRSAPRQTPAKSTDSAPLTSTLRKEGDGASNQGIVGNAPQAVKPQEWIMRIRNLIQEGNSKEAHTNLEKFRREYPNYPLPADLQELAP